MPPPPPKKNINKPVTPNFGSSPSSPAPSTPASAPERSEFKGSGKPKVPGTGNRQISQDEISRRAYEIYASRGYAAGDPNADWLEAERQLRAGL